jgi:hypothetical protein
MQHPYFGCEARENGLWPVPPTKEGTSQSSGDAAGSHRDQQETQHGGDQLGGQAFRRFEKIKEGLCLRVLGARGELLEGLDHLLTSLPTRLQHRQEEGKENGEYPEGKKAGNGAQLRSRAGIDSPSWVPAAVENDG